MSTVAPITFKQRVDAFWVWFSGAAEQLARQIDLENEAEEIDEAESSISQAVADAMDRWLPGFNYVVGAVAGQGYTFTLSPNGDLDLRFLAEYWISQSPQIDGWRFFSSRQPGVDGEFTIEIAGHDFSSADVRFTVSVDEEAEVVDVVVWHQQFIDDDEINSQVALIFLDEALGEVGTEMWVGKIELSDQQPVDGIEMRSLASEVVSHACTHQWEKQTPEKTYTGYNVETPGEGFPRADTIAGATCHFPLVGEFMEREGLLENDPIASYGARFAYLAIDSSGFDPETEVQTRVDIESHLNDLLNERGGGRVLGGATGIRHAYIDLLLVDGENSNDLVQQSMERHNLETRYRVEPFFQTAAS